MASRRKSDDKKEEKAGMSTAAKVGLGVGAAAVVIGGAATLLAKWYDLKKDEEKSAAVKQLNSYPSTAQSQMQSDVHYIFKGTNLIQVLEEVNKIIALQRNDVRDKNICIKNFIRLTLIEELRNSNQLFKKLYQDILWTGSFYEGLKISAPDEFDLNIVLRLPVNQEELEVTTKGATKAYICINKFKDALLKLKMSKHPHYEIYSEMEEWCDEKGSLLQTKLRSWMESLMDKYLRQFSEKLKAENGFTKLSLHKAGPAMMLQINNWSIDLVPVIEFRHPLIPQQPFRKLPYPELPWYAVPKPKEARPDVWRLSFCLHEKQMIFDLSCIKPAIRLIKKLRETRGWKNLCSYYIKTVAFWEIHDDKTKNHLRTMKLDQMFMHLLKRLQQRLDQDTLNSYWDPRYNLLENWTPQYRQDLANEVGHIIVKFEKEYRINPAMIGEIICY